MDLASALIPPNLTYMRLANRYYREGEVRDEHQRTGEISRQYVNVSIHLHLITGIDVYLKAWPSF
jgi:hypothetical protein